MKRRSFVLKVGTAAATLPLASLAHAGAHRPHRHHRDIGSWVPPTQDNADSDAVLQWNAALTGALAATAADPTPGSRAVSMVYEAVYNAWASYHLYSSFTLGGLRRRPWLYHTPDNKIVALSHAAYAVLMDLFPTQQARFDATLAAVTGTVATAYLDPYARATGQAAAAALLAFRHADGSNQLGDLAPGGAYADTSGYMPVNGPDTVVDPTRWQPLRITNLAGQVVVQQFLTPHWGSVRPFALPYGSALRPDLGQAAPTPAEMDELIKLSAALNDTTKATVDYWAANPGSVTPSGMWAQIAETVSAGDGNQLDDDVRMFFALGQALLDAGIACWDAKRAFDSVRPITAIRWYYRGRTIQAWGGPGTRAPITMLAENWWPYQRYIRPSPNFPEFPSGHSTFSHAAAVVLGGVRGGDAFPLSFTFGAGKVPFDPTVPAQDVVLNYTGFLDAAAGAGFSRRLGGIHFTRGDLYARALGRRVGRLVLAKVNRLFAGG